MTTSILTARQSRIAVPARLALFDYAHDCGAAGLTVPATDAESTVPVDDSECQSGDGLVFVRLPEGRGVIAGVIDACGHGRNPRTLALARIMLDSVRKTVNRSDVSLKRILLRLHIALRRVEATGSASFIHLDWKQRVMWAAAAAAPPPVIVRRGKTTVLADSSMLLGAGCFARAEFEVAEHPIPGPDELVGIYSDSWENAESPNCELFDPEERLARIFDSSLSLTANLGRAFHALQIHCEGKDFGDDTSLLLLSTPPDGHASGGVQPGGRGAGPTCGHALAICMLVGIDL